MQAQDPLARWLLGVHYGVCSSATFWPGHRHVRRCNSWLLLALVLLCWFGVSGAIFMQTRPIRLTVEEYFTPLQMHAGIRKFVELQPCIWEVWRFFIHSDSYFIKIVLF